MERLPSLMTNEIREPWRRHLFSIDNVTKEIKSVARAFRKYHRASHKRKDMRFTGTLTASPPSGLARYCRKARAKPYVYPDCCLYNHHMKIGITTTVPIEIIYAAGHVPVDLNNLFIASPDYQQLTEEAELVGFPRNFCAWVKGIYGVVKRSGGEIGTVVAVTQGDCSNTKALMETLESDGVEVIPFAYPYDRDRASLKREMEKLAERLGAESDAVEETTRRLDEVRRKVWELDRLGWQEGRVTGTEGHIFQVSCSDMEGDIDAFEARVDALLGEARLRPSVFEETGGRAPVRLGYVGVPPLAPELYAYLEEEGARVVYHEVQRQFTLPAARGDLTDRYLDYTYPYSIFERLKDIEREVKRRDIQGVIHYVQSFCFRQVEDILLRRRLAQPLLTVELDSSTHLDARTRMRLENFVNMLKEGRGR